MRKRFLEEREDIKMKIFVVLGMFLKFEKIRDCPEVQTAPSLNFRDYRISGPIRQRSRCLYRLQ